MLILVVPAAVRAEVRLPAIISDNMVLQQEMKVRIWGNAKPGEPVTVTFDKKIAGTVADPQGRWQVSIGPLLDEGRINYSFLRGVLQSVRPLHELNRSESIHGKGV